MQRDLLAKLAVVGATDDTYLIAEVQAKLTMLNKLVHKSNKTLEWSQEVHIFLAGFSKAGKSTLCSAFIQDGIETSPEYYNRFYTDDEHILRHKLIDADFDVDDTVKAELEAIMTELYAFQMNKVEHEFGRYDLNRVLCSQGVGPTTTAALTVESCGDSAPSVTFKFKSAGLVHRVLAKARRIIKQYTAAKQQRKPMIVTSSQDKSYQKILEHANTCWERDL
jgi:hypothetical protein